MDADVAIGSSRGPSALIVEGEAVRRPSSGRGPSVSRRWVAALAGVLAVGIGGAFVSSRDRQPEAVVAELSAVAENPGRYGLYQQRDTTTGDAAVEPGAADLVSPPALPVDPPEASYDPAVALASHNGSIVAYATSGRETVLRVRAGAGQELSTLIIEAGFALGSLSSDGSQAALWRLVDGQSEIVVVDTEFGEVAEAVAVDGSVVPEAFSADGRSLFVVQEGTIGTLDLDTGALEVQGENDVDGVVGRKTWSPDGTRLYTLYASDDSAGFVRLLDLAQKRVFHQALRWLRARWAVLDRCCYRHRRLACCP